MKILLLFVDMLRSDFISNEISEVSSITNLIKNMKGVNYTNCYTPAPDTYRSLATFWTGTYPLKNGVNNRNYTVCSALNPNVDTFLQKAVDNGYAFNCYCGPYSWEWPIDVPHIKHNENGYIQTGGFFKEFVSKLEIKDDSISMLIFDDLHCALDDFYYTKKGLKVGINHVFKNIELFFEKNPIENFDRIILFSDHGYRTSQDIGKRFLDYRRSKVVMFYHKKGDMDFVSDEKLVSIMDVCPTLLEDMGIKYDRKEFDGISFHSVNQHDYLLFEDTETYYPMILQPINRWAVVDADGMYFMDEDGVFWPKCEKSDFYIKKLYEGATNFKYFLDSREKVYKDRKKIVPNENYIKLYSNGARRRRRRKINSIIDLCIRKLVELIKQYR